MKPYVVRRSSGPYRRVVHRATGRFLGEVARKELAGDAWDGWWSAWGPFSDDAIGTPYRTMEEAVDALLRPEEFENFATALCSVHRNLVTFGKAEDCEACRSSATVSPAVLDHLVFLRSLR